MSCYKAPSTNAETHLLQSLVGRLVELRELAGGSAEEWDRNGGASSLLHVNVAKILANTYAMVRRPPPRDCLSTALSVCLSLCCLSLCGCGSGCPRLYSRPAWMYIWT